MKSNNNELYKAIERYKRWGFSIIPIGYKSKKPLIEWKPYQERRADNAEIGEWFAQWETFNIGIVCGEVSGNLVGIDIDSEDEFHKRVERWKELRGVEPFGETPVVITKRGKQIYVHTKTRVRSQKLPGIDIKAEGGYVIAPPSVHPSGAVYQFINPEVTDILEVNDLSEVGIELPDRGSKGEETDQLPEVKELAQLITPYWQLGDRHNLALSLSGFLAKMGWASPMVKELIKEASLETSDEELKDRLCAVDTTFQKA